MPALIGPPSVLACWTLGLGWAGLFVALGGTYWVARDALKSRGPLRYLEFRALAWAALICSLWVAAAAGIIMGLFHLFIGEEFD